MKKQPFLKWSIAALVALLALTSLCAKPQPVKFSFETSQEGWIALPPPAGVETTLTLSDDSSGASGNKQSLQIDYTPLPKTIAGVLHAAQGLTGQGVRLRVKTATAAMLVLGLAERDGSNYMHVLQTVGGKWQLFDIPINAFVLSNDSSDENTKLNVDQIGTLIVADAAGFSPLKLSKQTIWLDEYEILAKMDSPKPKPYISILDTGLPSTSGARATARVTYPKGKIGQGMLASTAGQLVVLPLKFSANKDGGWSWDQGTVEMWISPQFDMTQVQDFSSLIAMQDEPFMPGLRGSLQIIYTKTQQIGFMINANMENILGSPVLNWKKGEWHHVAVSWGANGMHFYLDGKMISKNSMTEGPGILSADMVVGSHAWPVAMQKMSNTVIDELRVSKCQRTDSEIAASAKAALPLKTDVNTLALEHFDGSPVAPIEIKAGTAAFNETPIGQPVSLIANIPGKIAANAQLSYTITTPDGRMVRKGVVRPAKAASSSSALAVALAPFDAPGYYRIALSLLKGQQLLNKGIGWVKINNPATPASSGSLLFGASGCYADFTPGEAFFKYAAAAGVRSLRTSFEWFEIEPAEGQFVWTKYDQIVKWADKYGVQLIPTFIWEKAQPAWAGQTTIKKGTDENRYPPEDMAKWSEFITQVVNRYKGSIHWWIPANEPNLARYWAPAPDPKAYTALLKTTSIAVKRADPQAKMLGCSVSGMDLTFLEECFKEGALDYSDAIGAHPYICPNSPDASIPINILDPSSQVGTFAQGLAAGKALIEKYGGKQKFWLDEAGQPYRDDFIATNWGVPEPTAAEYMTKILLESMASGAVDRVMWFSFFGGEYGSFALVKPDGTPTLPMAAYTAASDRLSRAEFVKLGNRGEGVRSLIFKSGNRQIEALWRPNGVSSIELQPGEQAYDMYGFKMEISGNSSQLKLSAHPVYIESGGN